MIKKAALSKIVLTIIMLVLAFIVIFPFILMLSSSLKPLNEIYQFPPKIISPNSSLSNYKKVLFEQTPSFLLYLKNTAFTTLVSVLGTVVTASLGGYAFAKLKFKGRDTLFLLYLATMMIPFQALMVPQFILFRYLGIFNTLWALILPRLFSPLGTFLMRQNFAEIPNEIIEAGRIDGENEFGVFLKLVLPLAKPALATVSILNFVWRWNDYEAPLIFITNKNLYTLTIGLTNFIDDAGSAADNLIMAAAFVATIPIIIVFIFGQKYIIDGMTTGSVKG